MRWCNLTLSSGGRAERRVVKLAGCLSTALCALHAIFVVPAAESGGSAGGPGCLLQQTLGGLCSQSPLLAKFRRANPQRHFPANQRLYTANQRHFTATQRHLPLISQCVAPQCAALGAKLRFDGGEPADPRQGVGARLPSHDLRARRVRESTLPFPCASAAVPPKD